MHSNNVIYLKTVGLFVYIDRDFFCNIDGTDDNNQANGGDFKDG